MNKMEMPRVKTDRFFMIRFLVELFVFSFISMRITGV